MPLSLHVARQGAAAQRQAEAERVKGAVPARAAAALEVPAREARAVVDPLALVAERRAAVAREERPAVAFLALAALSSAET